MNSVSPSDQLCLEGALVFHIKNCKLSLESCSCRLVEKFSDSSRYSNNSRNRKNIRNFDFDDDNVKDDNEEIA